MGQGQIVTTIFAVALFYALVRLPVKPQTAQIAVSLNEPDRCCSRSLCSGFRRTRERGQAELRRTADGD